MNLTLKRLFFGLEVHAPWPTHFPKGNILAETQRHVTLSFLGHCDLENLLGELRYFPLTSKTSPIGFCGLFDYCLFLPPKTSHVVAWHNHWYHQKYFIEIFQRTLTDWLKQLHFSPDSSEWLPHTTICRGSFDQEEWLKSFIPLPFFTQSIHLYESLGNATYQSVWNYPVLAPFEQIASQKNHLLIRASSLSDLYYNAFTALAFKYPSLVAHFIQINELSSLDEVTDVLNQCMRSFSESHSSGVKSIHLSEEPLKNLEGVVLTQNHLEYRLAIL